MAVNWTKEQEQVINLRNRKYSGKCSSWFRKDCGACAANSKKR